MARKKTEEQESTVDVVVTDAMENTQAPEIKETELTEFVKNILSIYPDYQSLYIDSKGGVYPEDAKPNAESDAILYQNPYYKS